LNHQIDRLSGARAEEKGSHREAASQIDTAAHFDGEIRNSLKIPRFKIRVVLENLLLGCTGRQPAEDVPYSNAQAADAGLAGTLAGLDRNPGFGGAAHVEMITRFLKQR